MFCLFGGYFETPVGFEWKCVFLDSSFQRLLSHVAFIKIHEAVALVWLSACESLRNETGHCGAFAFPSSLYYSPGSSLSVIKTQ